MALKDLFQEKVWLDKVKYLDAERIFHEKLSKVSEYESSIICSRDSKSSETINAISYSNNASNELDVCVNLMKRKSPDEEINARDKCTAQNPLAHICKSESVKKKKLKKMVSTLKLRKMNQCDTFSLCDQVTKYHKYIDINKLLSNIKRWDTKVENQYKSINNFDCLICYFQTNKFDSWKLHIMSITHLLKCNKTKDLYSYVCFNKKCKVLFYGPEKSLDAHTQKHLEKSSITGIPILMAEVLKRFTTKKNDTLYFCSHCKNYAEEPIHSDSEKSNTNIKCPVKYYCEYCRVDFYSSPEMIDYHSLSVEHLILKCFDKLCFEAEMISDKIKTSKQSNENKEESLLATVENEIITTNPVPLPNVVQDILLLKNSDFIEVKNEHMPTVQVNKRKLNESHDNKSSHKKICKRYTRYFKHKLDILKLLRQYKERIMKTLAYYCNMCDFVTQEKYVWDKHIETEHSGATYGPTVHCSTCSMMIVGWTYEEHICTAEHCDLLKFVQSFEPVKNDLEKDTVLIKLVDTSLLNETFIDSEQNKSLNFNETNSSEAETLNNPNSANDIQKNKDCILENESNSKAKNQTNTNTLSFDTNYDQNKYVKNDEALNPVNCKTTPNKIIDGNSTFDVSTTCDKTASDIDEDKMYGEYVTQRLKNIKNSTIKQDIQLEIDYLFYSKIKKLLQKNA